LGQKLRGTRAEGGMPFPVPQGEALAFATKKKATLKKKR
jgi:hypothetical protein